MQGRQAMNHNTVSASCTCSSCARDRRRQRRARNRTILILAICLAIFALGILLVQNLPAAEERRSGKWAAMEKAHLAAYPTCAVCGGKEHLNVHHIRPYHLYPELELDPDNLITLCEGSTCNCHLFFGHLGDFKSYNLNIKADAARMLKARENRPYKREDKPSSFIVSPCFQQAA